MSEPAPASASMSVTDRDHARDLACRVGASAAGWVRQNPPCGRWRTWVFTVGPTADAIGPTVEGRHLSPGSPTEYGLLESVVRRTSGIRTTGQGLALAFPASLRDASGSPPVVIPRHSGADPLARTRRVVAVAVQLSDTDGHAVIVDADDRPGQPFDPAGEDDRVVFPAPDLVPAFLRRAVAGEDAVGTEGLPPAGRLRVQGWVATVISASLEHGSDSGAVEVALDAAPSDADVRSATLERVHDLVIAGELGGMSADHARWCGPTLTARVVAGHYGRLPELLRFADDHWPRLGAELGRRTRELLGAAD